MPDEDENAAIISISDQIPESLDAKTPPKGLVALCTIAVIAAKVSSRVTTESRKLEDPGLLNRPLNKDEAARYLGINSDTLCKWSRSGRIAYSRLGDGARAPMRFSKKDLDAYLSKTRIPTVEEVSLR
jgi:excisionase family DNA binding protein